MVCDCDDKCDETCRCRGFSHGCVDDCKCRDCKNSYDDLTYPSLEVKSSNIKGAGNGQFTQEYIAKGTIIGEYTGEIVNNRGRSSTEDLSQLAISKCEHALHNQAII
jgi:hypothetical protein